MRGPDLSKAAGLLSLVLLFFLGGPESVGAQGTSVLLEVGGSSIQPPEGVAEDAARFVVAGLRGTRFDLDGTGVMASVLGGWSLDGSTGGDFFSGTVEGALWRRLGKGWSGGLETRGFGFEVVDPFPYRALGVEGGPSLRFSSPHLSATVSGLAGLGWSRTELLARDGMGQAVLREELWRYGGTAELLVGSGGVMAGAAAGIHDTPGGSYRSAGLRFLWSGGGPVMELRVDAWRTPLGNETTGGLAFMVPLGGWSVRGFLGRGEPDPLTLTEPGGRSGGVLLGREIYGTDPLPPPRPPLHRVVERSGTTATVEIGVEPPGEPETVAVMGDFTFWEPRTMTRHGDRWTVHVRIPAGTHHFGFLVDGEWYLPADAPDVVPDEWGRRNATLVIEP